MITLSKIKESILNNDEGLELLLFDYFNQIKDRDFKIKKQIDKRKNELKKEIEESIFQNNIEYAKKILEEYKNITNNDLNVYSIEGIIAINENNLEKAFDIFSEGLSIDNTNVDLLYNMAQLASIIGDVDSSVYYYNECLSYTNDIGLIDEIGVILNNLCKEIKNNTIIAIGIEESECSLFLDAYNVINIIENINIENEKEHKNDNYIKYEVNPNKLMSKIELLVKRNKNCILIFNNNYQKDFHNSYQKKLIDKFYGKTKIAYYINENYYTEKINYYRNNKNLFMEKIICNNVDFIITKNVNIYNYKKIIEERNNVCFIGDNIDFNNYIEVNRYLKKQFENFNNEYEKLCYALALEYENLDKSMKISKYLYEKYDTQEMYHIYITILKKRQEYSNIAKVVLNSKYCSEVFKGEINYLNNIENYDLLNFVIDLSIKNYKLVDSIVNDLNINYKLAIYNFELNNNNGLLNKHLELLNEDIIYNDSTIINRNIYHLLYLEGNKNYKNYEKIYNDILQSILV